MSVLHDAITDVAGLSVLAGVGFTVSLLIGELAFGAGTERENHVKVAVLVGSVLSASFAALLLRARARTYARIAATELLEDAGDHH